MDEPLLIGPGNNSMKNFEPQGVLVPGRSPIRKSEYPTFSLISPRTKSFTSPMGSPRQMHESLRLNKEQGRRTEKFYVPPSYGDSYFPQGPSPSSMSFSAPRRQPTPAYLSPSGSSLTSMFRIPEDYPTIGSHQTDSRLPPIKDLEAAPLEDQRRDHDWRDAESVGNTVENVESAHQHEDSHNDYPYPPGDESEAIPLLEPPNIGDFDINKMKDKRHKMHKCRTAPVLSSVAEAVVAKAQLAEEVKRNVLNRITATAIVWQASIGLLVYLFVGVMIYCWKKDEFKGVETVGWVDALYFCIVTMCTIGYGDITPITPVAKILSCALVLVGFGFIDALMSGMVTFVLDRQEHLLMNVVLDGRHEVAKGYVLNAEKGTMRVRLKPILLSAWFRRGVEVIPPRNRKADTLRTKIILTLSSLVEVGTYLISAFTSVRDGFHCFLLVFLAVGTVLGSITVGSFFLHFVEDLNWIDSVYVTVISITTVGYGDYSFQTMWGRLFAAVWLLLSTLGVARAFLFLAEARVQKRQRHFAKRMLQTRMTPTDMMDADIDNDGHVSVAEFVVYKLKAMQKISKTDIVDIVKQFEQLDTAGAGKISMSQLLEAEAENQAS